MNEWETKAAAAREEFLESLAAAGFTVRSSKRAEGEIDLDRRHIPVDITIPEGFPYEAPKVRPIDGSGGLSWHADVDGTLCLWASEETGGLPWRTAEEVVQRVKEWFSNDAAGWADDTPDLDLQRYWPGTSGLVLHPDLDGLVGKVSRIISAGDVWTVKPGPPRGRKQHGCLVVDVGELPAPLRSTDQVLEIVMQGDPKAERLIHTGELAVAMLRYWRQGNAGVLALLVTTGKPVTFKSIPAAHQGDSTLQLRAGPDRHALADKAVAVVGVGAIGAQAADLLARAGVGSMTLVDHDVVRPGNLIRHIAKQGEIGHKKVDVVRHHLDEGPAAPVVAVRAMGVTTISEATELLEQHDLVLEATANQTATRLLLDGAAALGRPVVSVCLVREGQVARIDRAPLAPGETHLPPSPEVPPSARLVEGGCGDPISPAPMWAATAAAARAVGACVDVMTGRNEYPPSLVEVLVYGNGACGPIGSTA